MFEVRDSLRFAPSRVIAEYESFELKHSDFMTVKLT